MPTQEVDTLADQLLIREQREGAVVGRPTCFVEIDGVARIGVHPLDGHEGRDVVEGRRLPPVAPGRRTPVEEPDHPRDRDRHGGRVGSGAARDLVGEGVSALESPGRVVGERPIRVHDDVAAVHARGIEVDDGDEPGRLVVVEDPVSRVAGQAPVADDVVGVVLRVGR